jgi:hypothetical protein
MMLDQRGQRSYVSYLRAGEDGAMLALGLRAGNPTGSPKGGCSVREKRGAPMITAIVLYDLPPSIGLEECREHFTKIAPDFLKAPGFVRKQFICRKEGGVAGGVYMWETQKDAEAFYTGPWRDGIRARYGNDPKIQYFETVALTDKATGKAGAI